MAANMFIQNPKHSPCIIRDKTPQQKHNLGSFFISKTTSKRVVISSSIMASSIPSSPLDPPPPPPSSPVTPLSRAPSATLPLSRVWREIQGRNNWENLIDPLSPILQQEITRYGNLLSASYKGFDLNPNSKRYLNCKYGKKILLKESGIHDPYGYQVTKYIYATPDININPIQTEPNCARWIGYVAVSSDNSVKRLGRRDIVVTFRGTVTNSEWLANLMSSLTPAKLDPHNAHLDVKVEFGFLSLYTSSESESKFGLESCREQLLSEISRVMNKHKGEEMSITLVGHSMGSSLAQLLAYDIAELGLNQRRGEKPVPVTVFSFAGPRVGNLGFKKRCEELGVKVLRITNVNDPITKLPGFLFNENFSDLGGIYELPWSCSCYTHVGIELTLDFFDVQNISCVHDLETYINLINRQKSAVTEDNFGGKFLNKTSEIMFSKGQRRALRNAATKVAYLLGSVSNHMLCYNIF